MMEKFFLFFLVRLFFLDFLDVVDGYGFFRFWRRSSFMWRFRVGGVSFIFILGFFGGKIIVVFVSSFRMSYRLICECLVISGKDKIVFFRDEGRF